jgi:hypothetical protein
MSVGGKFSPALWRIVAGENFADARTFIFISCIK